MNHFYYYTQRVFLLLLAAQAPYLLSAAEPVKTGSYRLCDFHQHTTFTDGEYSMDRVFHVCDSIGLTWWANSEHGGLSTRNGILSGLDKGTEVKWQPTEIKGDTSSVGRMWRWQTIREYAFPYLVSKRKEYQPDIIIQGLEWNVPGHEHASMSILKRQYDKTPSADAVSQFEYMFDNSDLDKTGGIATNWIKSESEGHAKALEALDWLQKNYPGLSWVIPAHPDRKNRWTIADFRDGNNVAPDVFFGFEGIPGHQQSPDRGEYGPKNDTYGTYTYGAAGWMTARVGGVWDALLSEGRRWWLFSCSDFHNIRSDFYPGEYNKTYLYMPETVNPASLADYLRSGNSFVVAGNFVNSLVFTVNGAAMGETSYYSGNEISIFVEVGQPEGTSLTIDHIDLIEGQVHGKIAPGTAGYTTDSVTTTHVIARFNDKGTGTDSNGLKSIAWKRLSNGRIQVHYTQSPSSKHTYYRLRATHHALNTPGETDGAGNPLPDNTRNTREMALSDQWLYSNPVFVKASKKPIEVVVHRGANHLVPENTLSSALKAIENGAAYIELDVRTSKDGIMYNLHDATLDRTTNGSGPIKALTSEEIDKLDAGSWFNKDFAGEKVSRIDAMLDNLKGKAFVFFDVKDANIAELTALVREKGFENESFFWFGNPKYMEEFVKLAPDLQLKVNAVNVEKLKEWMKICNPSIVETGVKNITPDFIAFCKENGIRIMAATQGETIEDYKNVINSGADMVNLDRPEVFKNSLAQ